MSTTDSRRIRGILAITFALATVVFIAQPAKADFTPANTAKLTKSVEVTAATGATTAFFDGANNVVHVLGTDTLTTYDADTLEVKASMTLNTFAGEVFRTDGYTFDPEHSIIIATTEISGAKQLHAFQYVPGETNYGVYDLNIPARPTVVYSSEFDRVYSIATADGYLEPSVDIATRDPDTGVWSTGSYPSIDIGSGNNSVLSVTATTAGKLVGTYAITGSGGPGPDDSTIDRKAIYSFADTGDALVPTQIPGTAFVPGTIPYPTSLPVGYTDFTPMANGSIAVGEFQEAAERQMITLDPSNANASGFVVNGTTRTIPFVPVFTDFDPNGDLYLSSSDTLFLSGDGYVVPSNAGPTVRGLTAGDGQAYAFTGASSPYKLSVYAAGAFSPTITIDPASQNLTVSSGSETKSVTLHSGATGTPDPTARWQKQLAGASTWGDIPDATSTDLTFDATAANDGDSFRAVYSNAAGEIATTSAQLTVTVDDTLDPVVTIQSPLNGSSTTAASTIVNYTVSDNADSAPECTVANGASVALTLGANTITVSCADDSGNSASATASVTRTAAATPPDNSVQAPAAPQGKNGKSVKLKYKKGKSARVAVGTVTCASITTCVYTIPASIKFKIGSKSYKAKVVGPKTLEPGKTQTVYATVLDGAIKKLKGKKSKLVVPVQVANSAGKLHSTTMSIISKISA